MPLTASTEQDVRALQRANDVLVSTLDATSEAILALQLDGSMIFNIRMVEMWGLPEQEIATITVETVRQAIADQAKDANQVLALFERLDHQAIDSTVDTLELKDGRFINRRVAPQLIHGVCVGRVITYRDVTPTVRHEQEMAFNVQVLENSGPMFWVDRITGAITYANSSACAHFGYELGEFTKLKLRDFSVNFTKEKVRDIVDKAMQGGPVTYKSVHRRKGGELRDVDVSIFLTEHAQRSMFVFSVRDVTERKRAESEAARQRALLISLIDSIPDCIFFKDLDGRYQACNKAYTQRSGFSVDQLRGRKSEELFPAARVAAIRERDAAVLSSLTAHTRQELIALPDGREVYFETVMSPVWGDDGKPQGLLAVSRDISERKHNQDALRELNAELEERVRRRTAELNLARDDAERTNQAKSEFLATMSHEIRTPMSGLLGLLELLAAGRLGAEQLSTLSVARDSGNALMRIINDILDFSKIEANSLELNLVAASVGSVMTSACRLHTQVAASKNLTLRCDVSPEISPLLSFDPPRLGQILNNFLNNAIKFTAIGGVEIGLELVGRHKDMEELLFTVRDTGIGMTPAQVSRLFQPFVQAAAQTSAQFGGTGLGLVISRRLAELMGGTVEVESELGVGTCLSLRLCLEVCDAAGPARSERADQDELQTLLAGRRAVPSIEAAEADGSLLLIADDHPTNRMVLMRQAASLGYAAEVTEDGTEALRAWQSGRFAAVITDCNMPKMNGYELAGAIREAEWQQSARRTPIIACTANALPSATQACLTSGMDDCLVKPASLADLSAVLARWVPLAGNAGAPESAEQMPPPAPAVATRSGASRREGLLDLLLLAEISGGDQVAQAEILLDFRLVNEADACALRKAVELTDYSRVAGFSHRIKGSCLMLGATLLGNVCARLEAAGAARDAASLATAMRSFEIELMRLNGYLEMFPSVIKKRT